MKRKIDKSISLTVKNPKRIAFPRDPTIKLQTDPLIFIDLTLLST